MEPGKLLRAVASALERRVRASDVDETRWPARLGYRTAVMLGKAERGRPKDSQSYVLGDTMQALGFERYEPGRRDLTRFYAHEWRLCDLTAYVCPENWDGCSSRSDKRRAA